MVMGTATRTWGRPFAGILSGILSATLSLVIPATLATAKPTGHATSPVCPLQCPAGYQVSVYTWELHPEHTVYDETGQKKVADDSLWPVSCALKCEQHAPNTETKEWKDSKLLCKSGAEPGPFKGPWRQLGPWNKECAALAKDGCQMHCYPPPVAKRPAGRGKRGPAKK